MIKNLIGKLLGPTAKNKLGKRVDIPQSQHGINRELVDQRAWEVVTTLKDAGFEAYIVGGAVRDLLLGLRPKDFDVATNATPEEVKSLFRRAFIIGRRFRIVHVVFGRGREHEVIEVSTFRANVQSVDAEQVGGNERTSKTELAGMKHAVDASGRVLRDNVWGPQIDDAARRDFTINAMYYDPETQMVVDYHNGLADSKKLTLKLIGDAATRYREDPVRIIRAVRFAAKLAKLGFKLDPKTAKPLAECKALLNDVPQSRLFDEMLKLLQTGHALASIAQLKKLGLAQGIYPLLDLVVERADQPFITSALQDTDRRVGEDKPVAPSFLLACVLWSDVREGWDKLLKKGLHPFPALTEAIDDVFNLRIGDVSGRGKLASDMREIWMMQPRFDKRTGATPFSLVEHLRFRAGFDFLRLRAEVGEVDVSLADWWQEFSMADMPTREDLVQQLREQQRQQPKAGGKAAPRGGRTHRAPDMPPDAVATATLPLYSADGRLLDEDTAPQRRRPRRGSKRGPRRPGDEGGDAGGAAGGGAGPADAL
jgi:poly(A) polymerase